MGFAIINSEGKDNPLRNNATNSLEINQIGMIKDYKYEDQESVRSSRREVCYYKYHKINRNFVNILRASFFTKHLWWLLLKRRTKENNSYAKKNVTPFEKPTKTT